jgi:hypothetical protein
MLLDCGHLASPSLARHHAVEHHNVDDDHDDDSNSVTTMDTARRSLRLSVPVSLTDR